MRKRTKVRTAEFTHVELFLDDFEHTCQLLTTVYGELSIEADEHILDAASEITELPPPVRSFVVRSQSGSAEVTLTSKEVRLRVEGDDVSHLGLFEGLRVRLARRQSLLAWPFAHIFPILLTGALICVLMSLPGMPLTGWLVQALSILSFTWIGLAGISLLTAFIPCRLQLYRRSERPSLLRRLRKESGDELVKWLVKALFFALGAGALVIWQWASKYIPKLWN